MATVITNSTITIDGNTNFSGTNVTADSATITNLSGTNVTADSATITNLTTTNLSGTNMTASGDITGSSFNSGQLGGRRNLIINGAMKVAQRGASISGGTGRDSYGLDRFVFEATDNPITTQVTHSNSKITDGNRKALKISTTGTAIGTAQVHQRIERETFRHTIGQTVTFSCLVKRNSSTVTGGTLRMIASVNANATYVLRDNPGIYPSHTVTETLVTGVQNIPTDYTRYTASFTMPSGANTTDILEIGLSFYLFSGAAATEDLFSISEMQLELGDTATPFEHRSYGEELALCQRYYFKPNDSVVQDDGSTGYKNAYGIAGTGYMFNSTFSFPVKMRASPAANQITAPVYNNSSNIIFNANPDGYISRVTQTSSGVYRAYNWLYEFDAEL